MSKDLYSIFEEIAKNLRKLLESKCCIGVGYTAISAATNNATVVKASPGTVYSVTAVNTSATIYYLKFYNKATTPVPATDGALLLATYPVPASTDGNGLTISIPEGLYFKNGISYALVSGIATNDNGSAAANAVAINIVYK